MPIGRSILLKIKRLNITQKVVFGEKSSGNWREDIVIVICQSYPCQQKSVRWRSPRSSSFPPWFNLLRNSISFQFFKTSLGSLLIWEYPWTNISNNGKGLYWYEFLFPVFFQKMPPSSMLFFVWHSTKCNTNFKPVSNGILKHLKWVIFLLDWNCL